MKVAIAGAGVAGRFLRRLMTRENSLIGENEIHIYDIGNQTACRINPCGWMAPSRYFDQLMKIAELDPALYILQKHGKVEMGGKVFDAEVQTINKPTLLNDLWNPQDIIYGSPAINKYDRVIDCTGTQRAFLPPLPHDTVMSCVQLRGRPHEGQTPYPVIKFVNLGYAWAFPLGDFLHGCGCHIGCCSLLDKPMQELQKTGFLNLMATHECGCAGGRVRLAGPRLSEPFFNNLHQDHEVWGCGESIGCVSPMIGEGIIPAMECACRLIENWNSADDYATAVMRQFDWMNRESMVMQHLLHGDPLSATEALTLADSASRFGAKIGLSEALDMIRMIL